MSVDPSRLGGLTVRAGSPWTREVPPTARPQLLSEHQATQLAKIASVVRFKKGEKIYEKGATAEATFNLISGMIATYSSKDDGHITAFLHPGDIFGLSEEGRYTNSAKALTAVTAYRIPVPALQRLLSADPELDLDIIIKLCEELRQAQRHAFILARKRAVSRLAMFLELQERLQATRDEAIAEIHLGMDRSAIAEYLAMSLPAVSRAFRSLATQKVIFCRDLRHVKILNRSALEKLADPGPARQP